MICKAVQVSYKVKRDVQMSKGVKEGVQGVQEIKWDF